MLEDSGQSWEDQLAEIARDQDLLNSVQTLKYVNVALLTVLVYDYCLTFDLEKRRIWTLKWKLPKCLFMFNRYILPPIFFFDGFSNAVNVGQKVCDIRMYTPIPRSAAIMTVELMLMLRVLALYGNSVALARFLVIQFIIQMIAGTFLSVFLLFKTRTIVGQNIFTGCLYDPPRWASLTWTPLFVVESTLVILTLYKCRKYGEFSPTIKILARGSAIYFVGISSILIFNIAYGHQYKLIAMDLAFPTSVFTSIAAARLSMDIRSLTVERGIATLAHQTYLPTILSFTSRSNDRSGSNNGGISSVQGISSRTGREDSEAEELEGWYLNDEDDEGV